MGLCKCPQRKVTNLFCYEHRVNVCEHCLMQNHPKVSFRFLKQLNYKLWLFLFIIFLNLFFIVCCRHLSKLDNRLYLFCKLWTMWSRTCFRGWHGQTPLSSYCTLELFGCMGKVVKNSSWLFIVYNSIIIYNN
jgi:hypothetical protein